ncbi:MAG: hypothetical protein OEZ36_08935 [Spirochaetota bacterium]|nr:hypothetical protein [Spirochaetota bacterium]
MNTVRTFRGRPAGNWFIGIGIALVFFIFIPRIIMPELSIALNVLIGGISIAGLAVLARGRGGLITLNDNMLMYYACSVCVLSPSTLVWKDILTFEYQDISSGKGKNNYYRRYLLKDSKSSISFYEKRDPEEIPENMTWGNTGLSGDEGIYLNNGNCKTLIDTVIQKSGLRPVQAEFSR